MNEVALENLTRQAMASGIAWLLDNMGKLRESPNASLPDILGDWPAEFLSFRTDLVEALDEDNNSVGN